MLTELYRKGGCLSNLAREGKLRCPLIVRPTSEDVITGQLVQALRILNPRWWLTDLLNEALRAHRFDRQIYRRLRIEPWVNKPRYPRELLPWDEGSTQVDCVITWENPPTTVYIEMKYTADLAAQTAGDDGQHGYPSDQLIRNLRVGLLETGWFGTDRLFRSHPRDFLVVLFGPTSGHRLVQHYRDPTHLLAAIPRNELLTGFPRRPFVGDLNFSTFIRILRRQRRWFTRAEQQLVDDLVDYLAFKQGRFQPATAE
jgi:hypothetical protein